MHRILNGFCKALIAVGTFSMAAYASAPVDARAARQLIVFVPQTDGDAAAWLKLFDRYPHLRMVIAVSPRFQQWPQNTELKNKTLDLQKTGRLELALQLPNPPILPLLLNTDSAKPFISSNAPLPQPPFAYPDDVTQIAAHAKADFASVWGQSPKGLILPYGAVTSELLDVLNHLTLQWVVGVLGAPPNEGAYHRGTMLVWDAAPAQPSPTFTVRVWDERQTGSSAKTLDVLNHWAQDLEVEGRVAILPSDPNLPAPEIPGGALIGGRTWLGEDWTRWIGSPLKNTAWDWLRRTREVLEAYKNSGQASVQRLDMAFQEFYTAENANFFADDNLIHEYQATLASVYRLIGQNPPDDFFEVSASTTSEVAVSSVTSGHETMPDGREHLFFDDRERDDNGSGHVPDPPNSKAPPGIHDLRRLEVWVSSDTLEWSVALGSVTNPAVQNAKIRWPLVDIYIDLNHRTGAGTLSFFPDRGLTARGTDAWEYALILTPLKAQLLHTRNGGSYGVEQTFPVILEENRLKVRIPRKLMRGNPLRWGYQVLVMLYDREREDGLPRPWISAAVPVKNPVPVYDILDLRSVVQSTLLSAAEEGQRTDIPFVRLGVHP